MHNQLIGDNGAIMTRQDAERLLNRHFKLPKFYDEQWETIEKILKGERVLLIEKTGFGKSLCFQFPATVFEGTTVIFSPLIALMRDQVKKLTELGISAKCINSSQTNEENSEIIESAKQGKIKILYIAPERQENAEWIEATRQMNLSMVVVDEAHCISVWGHDFRPAFKRIINLVRLLPKGLPVLATTATATKRVEQDVARQIGEGTTTIRGNLLRVNFKLFVIQVNSEDEKMIWLGRNLAKFPGSGILYTGTRTDAENYSKWLEYSDVSSICYHAGVESADRVSIEAGLMSDRWKCIVSTNALGMGIDKPNIRFIIHTQIPQSPIHYYQEIGRAGRDGETAYIILFYNPADRRLPLAFIETAKPPISKYEDFLEIVKKELLSEREVMTKTNLKQTQVRTIKADLLEQGIIREVILSGRKKYEYVPNSPAINSKLFEELRELKLRELDKMIEYVHTKESRMKFLCDYLGDDSIAGFENCDNTGLKKLVVKSSPEWDSKLQVFKELTLPELECEDKNSNIVFGVAAFNLHNSKLSEPFRHCKYEAAGDFPDEMIEAFIKAYYSKLSHDSYDIILHIPSTASGTLVKNFAIRIANRLSIPISHGLKKTRKTQEQRFLANKALKTENVKDAFTYADNFDLSEKTILLIDDLYDSGCTMKEAGRFLTKLGAAKIVPIVIAKNYGGDVA